MSTPNLTEQQVADLLNNPEILTAIDHRALLNGDSIDADLPWLTRAVNIARHADKLASVALNEWLDKTEWVQEDFQRNLFPSAALGRHRADIMRSEIERLRQVEAQAAADKLDAARWRALLGSDRIRMLGSAGLENPEPSNYAHFGMEIWTTYSTSLSVEQQAQVIRGNDLGRRWLTTYADVAIKAQEKK